MSSDCYYEGIEESIQAAAFPSCIKDHEYACIDGLWLYGLTHALLQK